MILKQNNIKSQQLGYYFGRIQDPFDNRDYQVETFKNPSKFSPWLTSSAEVEKEKYGEQKELVKFGEFLNDKFDINDIPDKGLPKGYNFVKMLNDPNNQLELGSCTKQSASCSIEYFIDVIHKVKEKVSILYGYKKTRDVMGVRGDTGATLRATMKALRIYGYIPDSLYPYQNIKQNFDKPIPKELEDIGKENQAVKYLRVDSYGKNKKQLLLDLKKWAWYEVPIIFGFWVWDSCLRQAEKNIVKGKIPYPDPYSLEHEQIAGGHAVTIVGYDDNLLINNINENNQLVSRTRGAFLIRNSWGKQWGENGYGWLPYEYVLNGLATDFWVLLNAEFMNLKVFEDY